MTTQVEIVTSAYKDPPAPKKAVSVRLSIGVVERIEAVMRIWQETAKARGRDEEDINIGFVIDALLAKATDEELQQWGGLPKSKESWAAVLEQVREAAQQ